MILLTGGLGYIGSHTAVELLDNGYEKHAALLKRSIVERIPVEFIDEGMKIELCIDMTIGKEENSVVSRGRLETTASRCQWDG